MQTKFRIKRVSINTIVPNPWLLKTPNNTCYWFNSFESAVFNFNVLLKGRTNY